MCSTTTHIAVGVHSSFCPGHSFGLTRTVVDWGKSDGVANRMTIGSGCRKGTKPCDLLEFVQYINKGGQMPVLDMKNAPKDWDPRDMKAAHVDWAAKALRDAGATGIYEPSKIYKGVGRNDVDGLFRKVGEFVNRAKDASGVPANSFDCAKAAVNVWADLRTWERGKHFMNYLNSLYPDAHIEPIKKDVGNSGDKVETIDIDKAKEKIRALPNMAKYGGGKDLKKFDLDDPGHAVKVALAKQVKDAIKGGDGECG